VNKARFGFFLTGSSCLACVAIWTLGACGSDTGPTSSSNPTSPPPSPSSPPTADKSSGSSPGTPSSTDAGTPPADAGSDCGKPAKLFPPKADGGLFCPFSATGAGGKDIYCPQGDQCCQAPKGTPSTCVAKGAACPVAASTIWECADRAECPTGQQCCAHSSAPGTAVTVSTDTCGAYLSKFAGTRCAASCTKEELVVCEEPAGCTQGACTAVKPKGNDIGVCK